MTTTIKWEQGDDGIVILTLDDPNQSRQHDERGLRRVDGRDGRPSRGREGRHQGRRPDLRRRRPSSPAATSTTSSRPRRRTRPRSRPSCARARAAAPAGDARRAGRRRDQRRGARRRAGDLPGHPPPRHRRRPEGRRRPPRGARSACSPAPAASSASVRMLGIVDALMQVLLQGKRLQAGQGQGARHRRRGRRHARGPGPGREGVDRGAGEDFAGQPWDSEGLQDPRRHADRTRSSRRTCRRSRRTCASSSRAPTTRPRTTSWPRRSRARRSTSTRVRDRGPLLRRPR